jgi:hypothetical protein
VAQNLLLDAIHHRASRLPVLDGRAPEQRRKKADQIEIDVSHEALAAGSLGPDRVWRNIVNIRDADLAGCDLFDIEELEDEYPADEFANLYMCEFVDDSLSAFKFNDLIACGCDSLVEWEDFNPEAARPMAPARSGPDTTRRKARPATTPRW